MNHSHWTPIASHQFIIVLPFVFAIMWYIKAALTSNHRYSSRKWPAYRYISFLIGIICAAAAVVGPLGYRAHTDFIAHMTGHLLLGMLAPLLIVLAAPMSLLLRTMQVPAARRFSRIFQSWPVRFICHPITAAILHIGGLWLLYMSEMYMKMQQHFLLHLIVHFHILAAGFLFTASLIYIDPIAHRFSFVYRAVVLMLALTGHNILSKYIYAFPPTGVSRIEAEMGAMLMYYGGDIIDAAIVTILFLQWYKAARPRKLSKQRHAANSQSTP